MNMANVCFGKRIQKFLYATCLHRVSSLNIVCTMSFYSNQVCKSVMSTWYGCFFLTHYTPKYVIISNKNSEYGCFFQSLHADICVIILIKFLTTSSVSDEIFFKMTFLFRCNSLEYRVLKPTGGLFGNQLQCLEIYDWTPLQLYNRPNYHQTSNIRRTKSQDLNVPCLVLKSSLPNLLKPGVNSSNL